LRDHGKENEEHYSDGKLSRKTNTQLTTSKVWKKNSSPLRNDDGVLSQQASRYNREIETIGTENRTS
jgi:hypothetical protein